MKKLSHVLVLGAILSAAHLGACSGSEGGQGDTKTGGSTSATGAGGAGGAPSGGSGGAPSGAGGAGGDFNPSTGSSQGSPEVCDGIDNDGNGVADDVDVGNDGICDCLRVATLGKPGQWGAGNVFTTWLNDRSDNGAVDLGDAVLTKDLLSQYQVIVAQDLKDIGRTYGSEEVAALKAWMEAGGGLMTLIGYGDVTELTNVNTLVAPLGMAYGMEAILPKQGTTVPITEWTPHPTTAGVMVVGVDNGYPVTGDAEVIATKSGYVVARAKEVGSGHIYMWGDEWITYDSEWKDHPDYQVELFWLNVIKWLTPTTECQVAVPQ